MSSKLYWLLKMSLSSLQAALCVRSASGYIYRFISYFTEIIETIYDKICGNIAWFTCLSRTLAMLMRKSMNWLRNA